MDPSNPSTIYQLFQNTWLVKKLAFFFYMGTLSSVAIQELKGFLPLMNLRKFDQVVART
jgi:hypothetical protein